MGRRGRGGKRKRRKEEDCRDRNIVGLRVSLSKFGGLSGLTLVKEDAKEDVKEKSEMQRLGNSVPAYGKFEKPANRHPRRSGDPVLVAPQGDLMKESL